MCEHCKECFCVKHMNPLFHGCQAAAAAASRERARAQLSGAGRPLKDAEREALARRLENKVAEMRPGRGRGAKGARK